MNLPEIFSILIFFISCFFFNAIEALKCKCTQSSWKTVCENGICEVSDDNSACLMLDHPLSGRHYACSQSPPSEEECIEKTTKSGATVKVCSCDSSDFCNFKQWPNEDDDIIETPGHHSSMLDGRRELKPLNKSLKYFPSLTIFIIIPIILLNLFITAL
uniref:Uncharacterized protein n=1 Tax=Panagrolaimus sp. PS1159 TaxID=55785 RepID=A0AC35G065_9BILA